MSGWLRHFVAMTALLSYGFFVSPMVFAQTSYQFDLPEQPLADSLRVIGRQTGMNIVFESEAVRGIRGVAVHGQFTADEAIRLVLVGTNLQAQHTAASNVVVKPKLAKSSSFDSSATESEGKLTEIIVTARKQKERLQEVPVPVSVVSGSKLADNGQVLLRDYAATIPGLSVAPSAQGYNYVVIRGLATGGTTNPTVGITLDDVAYGSSTAFGNLIPEIDPGELDHIEVLRGPQGTLYGANAMGGLVKYVTRDPSTEGYSGRFEAGANSVYNGEEPGYSFRASANIPLSNNAAIRISGFTRQDPGYIDNTVTKQMGVNRGEVEGGRLSLLWDLSDELTLKANALYQQTAMAGVSQIAVRPGVGDLQQNYAAGNGRSDRAIQGYSTTLEYKSAGIDFVSVTGYSVNRYREDQEFTYADGAAALKNFGVSGSDLFDQFPTRRFTQEVRATIPLTDKLQWQVGGYYDYESNKGFQAIYATNLTTGVKAGLLETFDNPQSYREYAIFSNVTYAITDRFDAQIGGRFTKSSLDLPQGGSAGILANPNPNFYGDIRADYDAFTYSFTPRYKLSDDLMVYARLASGYRPGGANVNFIVSPSIPKSYAPDKTYNYEFGLKGDLFEHLLTVDASLFYIDWRDVQLHLSVPPAFGYNGNGGTAKSEGVELSVTAHPTEGSSVSAWVTYDDAVINSPPANASVYLYSGERLAYSSPWSGHVSIDQDFDLWADSKGFVGSEANLVGDRLGVFEGKNTTPGARQVFPAYTQVNLHAGVRYDSWTTTMYVNNLGDSRGLLMGGIGFAPPYGFVVIPPRTVGVTIAKSF